MKLSEALRILNAAQSSADEATYPVLLACGFTPLHLETFLAAYLQKALQGRRVKVGSGLYGDLVGTLERNLPPDTLGVAIAIEWPDLDARLGYRVLGGWGISQEEEIAQQVQASLERLGGAIERIGRSVPVAVSLPTIPLPPISHRPYCEAGHFELEIQARLAAFALQLAASERISIVNDQKLEERSPSGTRHDLKAELLTGHPYSISHSEAVGAALAQLLAPPAPKKGIITDLDDTLWQGLVGEIGPEAVAWDLDNHALLHGLYQQTLAALADQGTLLAVASKNEPESVELALRRADIRLNRDKIYPLEVHWKPKSESVGRILKTWNIGADSVVFVDDNAMELAEVKAAWPEIDCLLFPKDDHAATLALFRTLRDLFGKRTVGDEDRLRAESIRSTAGFREEYVQGPQQDQFLSQAAGVLTVQFNPQSPDPRVLELVNKTNQFNLNGARYTDAEWRQQIDAPGSFLWLVSYEDKFGPLGKIAVLAGFRDGQTLNLQTWVMSCRAFSRRIEHGCLDLLFSHFEVEEVRFNFNATPKNGPLQECFAQFLGAAPEQPFAITLSEFKKSCPTLYFSVKTNP